MNNKVTMKQIENKRTWESFLLSHPHALFQSWEWGEVERRTGKKVWRVGLGQNYYGTSQIVKVAAKRGTFLHVRHGPILESYDKKQFTDWLRWIKQLAQKEKASFVRISPLIDPKYGSFLSSYGFRSAPMHSMDAEHVLMLDLSKSEEELLRDMRKTTRNLVRRAGRDGVIVKKSNDIELFLNLYKKTASRHGFVRHQAIREEFIVFSDEGKADLLFAYHNKDLLAGGIFLYDGDQAIYHHGASVPSKVPSAYLLQWEAIRDAKRRGMKYYNFWGITDSERKDHPWWGLTQFKRGFGGVERHYIHAMDLPVQWIYWITYGIESVRKSLRRY